MTSAELDNLVRIGKLKREAPSVAEFAGLVRSARARLADAGRSALAYESRFDLACNAARGVPLGEPLLGVPVPVAHPRSARGHVARAGQVPRAAQPRRIRRFDGHRRSPARRSAGGGANLARESRSPA